MISTIIIVTFVRFTIIFATLTRFQVSSDKTSIYFIFRKNNLSEKEYLDNLSYLVDGIHDLALEVSPNPYHLSNDVFDVQFG